MLQLGETASSWYNLMNFLASFMNLAGPDLIVILLIVLVLFGAKKLPELARGMGQAVKEFQKAKDEFNDEIHKAGTADAEAAKSNVNRHNRLSLESPTSRPAAPCDRIRSRRSRPATRSITFSSVCLS